MSTKNVSEKGLKTGKSHEEISTAFLLKYP